MFRVRDVDGTMRSVTAGRVALSDVEVRFQSPGSTGWVTVDRAPLAEVARVERRFNEADGRVRWVDESDVNSAAADARPEASTIDPGAPLEPEPAIQAEPPAPLKTSAVPPPTVSPSDVRCPPCGEQEELSGRRVGGDILPKELPTVDPQTLREMGKRPSGSPRWTT